MLACHNERYSYGDDLIHHMRTNHERHMPDSFVHAKKFAYRDALHHHDSDSDAGSEELIASSEDAIMTEQIEHLLDETPGHHYNQHAKIKVPPAKETAKDHMQEPAMESG